MNTSKFNRADLTRAVEQYTDESYEYYLEWLFDKPIVTSSETIEGLKAAGLILNKMIKYVSSNFTEKQFDLRMPVSDKVKEILAIFNKKDSYELGTFRTDFVFDTEVKPKFIEITCQFSLNAFFQAAVYNRYSQDFSKKHDLDSYRVEEYEAFMDFMVEKIGDRDSVCVIKGRDKIQSSRFFMPIFRNAGLDVKEISYEDVWENRDFLKKSLVINECMMDEIETLSREELELLADAHLINDYRNIFIAHDKRFFTILQDRAVQKQILTDDEMSLLNSFLIDTHQCDSDTYDKQEVIMNKDAWILKHVSLGRSREIFAGLELSQEEWEIKIESINPTDYILQKWVPQLKFNGNVRGVEHNDHLTGTLLYFDESYFGLGLFRASSHIIANKVDNRNIFPLVVKENEMKNMIDSMFSF
ncbi:MAG: hypothetical protein ACI9A7_001843 [Cyclobacteriaceae bacterium]|jgi:hypothetical protein